MAQTSTNRTQVSDVAYQRHAIVVIQSIYVTEMYTFHVTKLCRRVSNASCCVRSAESVCREAIAILESVKPRARDGVSDSVTIDTLARAFLVLHVVTDVDITQVSSVPDVTQVSRVPDVMQVSHEPDVMQVSHRYRFD